MLGLLAEEIEHPDAECCDLFRYGMSRSFAVVHRLTCLVICRCAAIWRLARQRPWKSRRVRRSA